MFKQNERNGVVYYSIPSFEATLQVKHGFSTRIGGVSEGPYCSLNLGLSSGDAREKVLENYRLFCDALDIKEEEVLFGKQVHDNKVCVVGKDDCGNGLIHPSKFEIYDGYVTNVPEVALMTFYADCVPLYFLDPVKKVIGLSHAGWRGTVGKIGKVTVDTMVREFGSNPSDILGAVGPSIGICCFETGEEVAREFISVFGESQDIVIAPSGKYFINLWNINKKVMMECGILEKNITISDLCTRCHNDIFFSHRGQNGIRGSLAAVLALVRE